MAGLVAHAVQPGTNRGVASQIEVPLARDVGIGVQRDVRDRIAAGRKEFVLLQVRLHRRKRARSSPVVEPDNLAVAIRSR